MININPFARGQQQARAAQSGQRADPARLQAIRAAAHIPGIRVVPATEELRKLLKHIPTGRGFRSVGSVEWPNDRFTQRRLAEGSIKIEEKEEAEQQAEKKEPTRTRAPSGGQT